MPEASQPREFTTTRWSVVLRVGGASPEQAQAALEQLCRDYWYPLYAYVRRKGHSPEDAADHTQDFFAKLLAHDAIQSLKQEGGRFRSFLLTALDRFLINDWQKSNRLKRHGDRQQTSLEALITESGEPGYLAELVHEETPEVLFQRAWAETILTRVLDRLARECEERGETRFPAVKPFLSAGEDPPALAATAAELRLSLPAFKSVLHRFRQRYRELLIDEVRQTVGSQAEVAEELRSLLGALQRL